MSAGFTKGPWFVHVERDYNLGRTSSVYICTGEGWPEGQIARANTMDGLNEREANARLIAAAPELLEALEKMVRDADRNERPGGGSTVPAIARAAIAKAGAQ